MILSWGNIFFEDETLGEGNFGQVVKAIIQIDKKCIVAAVKTLKGEQNLFSLIENSFVGILPLLDNDDVIYRCDPLAVSDEVVLFLGVLEWVYHTCVMCSDHCRFHTRQFLRKTSSCLYFCFSEIKGVLGLLLFTFVSEIIISNDQIAHV